MMMGAGLLFMLVAGLILIGIPVLIAALIAGGGGLVALFKSRPPQPEHSLPSHEPAHERKCPSCGRTVRPDWNVCPSCGAALT